MWMHLRKSGMKMSDFYGYKSNKTLYDRGEEKERKRQIYAGEYYEKDNLLCSSVF